MRVTADLELPHQKIKVRQKHILSVEGRTLTSADEIFEGMYCLPSTISEVQRDCVTMPRFPCMISSSCQVPVRAPAVLASRPFCIVR